MKTVWITRTQPGADRSAAHFIQAGFQPIIAPLLVITPPTDVPPLPPLDAVLVFTSQNGVDAFCHRSANRGHAAVCVGGATADAARKAGFNDVMSAGGTADDVSALILQNPQTSRPYWHIAGRHIRGNISKDLQAEGVHAQRHIFYESKPVKMLPDIDIAAVDVAVLYSPLAANTLAQLAPDLSEVVTVSISSATDAELDTLTIRRRLIAAAPHEDAMLVSLIAQTPQTG